LAQTAQQFGQTAEQFGETADQTAEQFCLDSYFFCEIVHFLFSFKVFFLIFVLKNIQTNENHVTVVSFICCIKQNP